MNSTPNAGDEPLGDQRLFDAHDLARAALYEITPESTVGAAAGYVLHDDGVVSLRFENNLLGYPGWFWTVSVAVVEGAEPTVLEVELLPDTSGAEPHALLAPEWVPWAERLADYQAAQAAAAAAGEATDDDPDLQDELDDIDGSDFDEDGSPILHSGDVDGVEIDMLDEPDEDEPDEDDEDDSDDDESDDDDSDDEDDSDEDDERDDEGSERELVDGD